MNIKLPVVSGKDVIKALSKIGYYVRDQRGRHVHLRLPYRKPLTVPDQEQLTLL
ncbi:MAG: type II toxin-antitoxin system HicA family toxin [Methanosarcinales archaeon]